MTPKSTQQCFRVNHDCSYKWELQSRGAKLEATYTTKLQEIQVCTLLSAHHASWCKANGNNVDSSRKLVLPSEKVIESCSTDQPKLGGNSLTDGKVDDGAAEKVDDAAAGKAVTKGAEMKKPWCRLISEFLQGPIWRRECSNSRPLVKGETTPPTTPRPLMNPTIEISEPRFMVDAAKELSKNAMECVIRREEGLSVKEAGPSRTHRISLAGASKNTILRTGDTVRFIGYAFGALHLSPKWGPKVDNRGRVVLSFKDNPLAKVGVRFDEPFRYGVDLGGLCDDSHGYFCKVSELCLDVSGVDDLDKLLANTLFEVVFNESRKSPFILFMKDAEKVMAGNSESYSRFKSQLEKLPDNVVIIGSHAHTDNHKEKVLFEIIFLTNRCM